MNSLSAMKHPDLPFCNLIQLISSVTLRNDYWQQRFCLPFHSRQWQSETGTEKANWWRVCQDTLKNNVQLLFTSDYSKSETDVWKGQCRWLMWRKEKATGSKKIERNKREMGLFPGQGLRRRWVKTGGRKRITRTELKFFQTKILTDVLVLSGPGKHMGIFQQFCYFQ